MSDPTYKELSKNDDDYEVSIEAINTGSLQRIADALEVIADQLILINKEKPNSNTPKPILFQTY